MVQSLFISCCSYYNFNILQEVVPSTAVHAVKELFVPSTRQSAVKAEAEALPSLDITKVNIITVLLFMQYHHSNSFCWDCEKSFMGQTKDLDRSLFAGTM